MRTGLNVKQKIVVALLDLSLLGELTLAVFLGQQNPSDTTGTFLRTFIPLALCSVVVAKILIRKLGKQESRSYATN